MLGIGLLLIVLVPALLQLFAISVLWQRVGGALQRAADRAPFTTVVTIQLLGSQPQAVSRLLDRTTRLDLAEIDALIDTGGGSLPLRLSHSAAERLAQALRAVGAVVTLTEYNSVVPTP